MTKRLLELSTDEFGGMSTPDIIQVLNSYFYIKVEDKKFSTKRDWTKIVRWWSLLHNSRLAISKTANKGGSRR